MYAKFSPNPQFIHLAAVAISSVKLELSTAHTLMGLALLQLEVRSLVQIFEHIHTDTKTDQITLFASSKYIFFLKLRSPYKVKKSILFAIKITIGFIEVCQF